MRLFFAAELPPDVQATLGRLTPTAESSDYRWVAPAQLHVTLAFLGQQPEDRLDLLRGIGAAAAAASRPALVTLGQPGSFGTGPGPRVLWLGLAGDVAVLETLHARLQADLNRAGFKLETRPFRTHVTLARRRESARGGAPRAWPPPAAINPKPAFAIERLTLFESQLSPRGATYVHVFDAALGS